MANLREIFLAAAMFRTSTNSISSSVLVSNRRYIYAVTSSYRQRGFKKLSPPSFQRWNLYHSSGGRQLLPSLPLLNVDERVETKNVILNNDSRLEGETLASSDDAELEAENETLEEDEPGNNVLHSSEEVTATDSSAGGSQAVPRSTLEILNMIPSTQKAELRRICRQVGTIEDISFPTRNPRYCRIHFDSEVSATKAKHLLLSREIFLGEPLIRYSSAFSTTKNDRYMWIPKFRGTEEHIEPLIQKYKGATFQIVSKPLPNDPTRFRVDAYMKFMNERHATEAKKIMKKKLSGLAGQKGVIAKIQPAQYYKGIGLKDPTADTNKFVTTPGTATLEDEEGEPGSSGGTPPVIAPIPEGSTNKLLLGNIPYELVDKKDEIIQKFSKYGQILDVHMPKPLSDKPRGGVYLQYRTPEEATKAFIALHRDPIYLFNRQIRVEFVAPSETERIGSPSYPILEDTVFLRGINPATIRDRWALFEQLSQYGEIADLRVARTDGAPNGNVFVQFLEAESAPALLEATKQGKLANFGRNIEALPGRRDADPDWINMENPPSDTLRAWNLPLRALIDEHLLMNAFGGNNKLISVRVLKDEGWPYGTALLHYSSVRAAQETLDWVMSDREHPVTFFGRPVRIHFARLHTFHATEEERVYF
ncbi:hypothetical protein CPB86DRAFT_830228 [Serendipita vermifera]|nr:hypothetical protein CPB86DRAFT_830228 [Serendipita vermifera]